MRNTNYKLPDYMLEPPDYDEDDYCEVDDDFYYDKQSDEEARYYYELNRYSYKIKI